MEMKKYKLGEIADIIVGYPFESAKFNTDGNGVLLVRGMNVSERFLRFGDEARYWNYITDDLKPYYLKENDIVIGMDGSKVGKNFALLKKEDLPLVLVQRVACIRAKKDYDQRYIWQYVSSKRFIEYVNTIKTGSSIPHISGNQISNFPIFVPDLQSQQKIATVLSSLDDKIALNRRMNAKLEQMAKRLYEHWFVQFDFPNADGKPYKASGGKMAWNETLKREIPEGWEVKKLDEVLDCNKNSMTSNSDYEYIRYLDTSSLTENQISELMKIDNIKQYPSRAKRIIQKNDILYSTVRPAQHHFGIIKNPVENMIASTGFAVLSCKMGSEYNEIFYQFITSSENIQKLDAIANLNASSYPSINPSDILDLKIALPTDISELKPFIEKFAKIYTMIELNQKEIQKLIALRNRLLPLLMNGQVEVL